MRVDRVNDPQITLVQAGRAWSQVAKHLCYWIGAREDLRTFQAPVTVLFNQSNDHLYEKWPWITDDFHGNAIFQGCLC
jgi:hypothetical protein